MKKRHKFRRCNFDLDIFLSKLLDEDIQNASHAENCICYDAYISSGIKSYKAMGKITYGKLCSNIYGFFKKRELIPPPKFRDEITIDGEKFNYERLLYSIQEEVKEKSIAAKIAKNVAYTLEIYSNEADIKNVSKSVVNSFVHAIMIELGLKHDKT